MVVLNNKKGWKRHVDHVRRVSMDRAVSDPSREMEAKDKPPNSPIAIPVSVCVLDPAPAPSVRPANVRSEMESGERQAQEEVPATAVDKALPIVTQSPEAVCLQFCRSSGVRKAPDRLFETI